MSETTAITRRISLAPDLDLLPLLGRNDDHLKTLETELDVRIVARGHDIMVKGDERQVKKAERALVTGIGWLNYGHNLGTTAALVMERRK